VADGWCWFVLREEYCWLVAGGWFVVREKYCWLVADKPSEQGECSCMYSRCIHGSAVTQRVLVLYVWPALQLHLLHCMHQHPHSPPPTSFSARSSTCIRNTEPYIARSPPFSIRRRRPTAQHKASRSALAHLFGRITEYQSRG
jgi:hypothetical protein